MWTHWSRSLLRQKFCHWPLSTAIEMGQNQLGRDDKNYSQNQKLLTEGTLTLSEAELCSFVDNGKKWVGFAHQSQEMCHLVSAFPEQASLQPGAHTDIHKHKVCADMHSINQLIHMWWKCFISILIRKLMFWFCSNGDLHSWHQASAAFPINMDYTEILC